jgi:DNA-binding NarL/FixJ family response regulator
MRAVIAEDSVLLREGLTRLLTEAGVEVVGQAGDADDLLRKTRAHKPDVVITDIKMPPGQSDEGLRAAKVIRSELPDTGVLVLSQYVEEGYAMELLGDSGEGVGYLLKDRIADVDRFLDAVRRVAEGGSALDPEVVSHMLGRRRREDPLDELTPRERQVLELMAAGATNPEIGLALHLSRHTIKEHTSSLYRRLGVGNRVQAVRRAQELGLLSPPTGATCARVGAP